MPYDERSTSAQATRPRSASAPSGAKRRPAQGRPAERAAGAPGSASPHQAPRPKKKGAAGSGKKGGSAPHAARQQPQKPRQKIDPSAATIDRPAHPLPAVRTSHIDYDRYLMRSTDKFKIFSAEEQRARNRHLAIGGVIALVAILILVWAVISRMLG